MLRTFQMALVQKLAQTVITSHVNVLRPTTSNGHTETGNRFNMFNVSSGTLETMQVALPLHHGGFWHTL